MKSANCTSITRSVGNGAAVAQRHLAFEADGDLLVGLGRALGDVGFVAAHPSQVVGQRGDRRDDVERIAVGLHDQRIGVLGEQCIQLPQMRGRFQQPLPGHTRLQVLQKYSVKVGKRPHGPPGTAASGSS